MAMDMKRAFAWLLFLCILIGGSFAAGRSWQTKRHVVSHSSDFDNGFRPAPFVKEVRRFVVVATGYNNGAFVERMLESVFAQQYDDYRLIYIDDASTDGSYELARDTIYTSLQSKKVTLIKNERSLGLLANWVRAIQSCQDDEIVVLLNGEDALAHEWVFATLNRYYVDPDLWLTYGQYLEFPTFQLGLSRPYKTNEIDRLREAPFVASHLKTFYAGLFRKIKETEVSLAEAPDLAIMLPMLEMARGHFQFIPDVLYLSHQRVSRDESPNEEAVRKLKPYAEIASWRSSEESE